MAGKNVMEFTTQNWEQEVVQSDKPVLVDFWAPWCGPCRQLTPTLEKLADQFDGKVKVGKLNVDDHGDIAMRFDITSIPAVLLFKGGDRPREKLVGLQPVAVFEKMINRALES